MPVSVNNLWEPRTTGLNDYEEGKMSSFSFLCWERERAYGTLMSTHWFVFSSLWSLFFVIVLSSSHIGRYHTEGTLSSGLLGLFDRCLNLSYNHSGFDEIYFPTIHFLYTWDFAEKSLSFHFSTSKKKLWWSHFQV